MLRPDHRIDRCEVERLPSEFDHALHAYFDVTPWNPEGTRLCYFGLNEGEDEGYVVVRDLETGEERVVARSDRLNYHSGAFQHWCRDGESVLYQSDGSLHLVDAGDPDNKRTLDGLEGFDLRTVLSDGVHVTVHGTPRASEVAEIARANLETEETETLVTVDETLEKLPPDLFIEDATWEFQHPVFNDDETTLFYKLLRNPPYDESEGRHPWLDGTRWAAFFVKDIASGEVRFLSDRVSGHPFWMDDNRHILNVAYPYDGSNNRRLVLMDADTGTIERFFDQPTEGPGHPSLSPDGRWIVIDAFTADGEAAPVYVFDLERGACREVVRLDHAYRGREGHKPDRITRGQPHPVWSPDGRDLLVNCNNGGENMELRLLTGFLP